MSKIFVSHSSKDKAYFVRRLAKKLTELGHETWYDEWSIKPGESLAQRIQSGITDCDYFLIVISENSIRSEWVQREVNDALVLEIERKYTTVIPIVIGSIETTDIPLTLRARRFIDFRTARNIAYKKVFQELINAIDSLTNKSASKLPVFICPPVFIDKELKDSDEFKMSVIDIICLENCVDTGFKYHPARGEVELFFRVGERFSQSIIFQLSETHVKELPKNSKPDLWRIFTRKGQNGLLKLQFKNKRKGMLLFYWINYAIERHMESRVRELTDDWDFEVTLGKYKSL